MHFSFAGAAQAALGIVADDVGNRPADTDQPFGVVEQLQVAAIPGHQLERLIDHADALGDVLDRALEQCTVELQHFRSFVGNPYYVFQLHFSAFNGRFYYCAGRRCAENTGQKPLGVGDPLTIGVLVGVKALALAVGETNKALVGALFTDKACSQGQKVVDLH